MIALMFVICCVALILAYRFYGRFLSRQFNIQDGNKTPACSINDGVDFVPTPKPVLFGHHFSSIAGAGPIVGPIIAAAWFGWGPTMLWIVLGAIFIGGLHDFGSLVMSVRHRARSVAEITRLYLSPLTYRFFLVFIWLALVYVLIVFLDLTVGGFVAAPETNPAQGGTVASASILYIFLAIVFGLLLKRNIVSLARGSLVFVPLVFIGLFVASAFPMVPGRIPEFMNSPKYTWTLVLLIYCFFASVAPVWLMLQPRDYLSSYLLLACLVIGGLGMMIGSITGSIATNYEFFLGFHVENAGYIFPVLFITVACGACSGFHSIVASGTTAKQLPMEQDARPIAYGGMLVEAALALVAMATVMSVVSIPKGQSPIVTFSSGIGNFLGTFGIPVSAGATFGLLAISTFLLTTLDTCTRLTRYIIEEFFNFEDASRWRYLTTLATLAPLFYFSFTTYPGPDGNPVPAWRIIWPVFGTTNQLLAALALLVVVVWRRSLGRSVWFIALPMLFMLVTTCTSMIQLIAGHIGTQTAVIGWVNIVMLLMTVILVADTLLNWGRLGSLGAREEQPAEAV
jgi:carbon starvation protein